MYIEWKGKMIEERVLAKAILYIQAPHKFEFISVCVLKNVNKKKNKNYWELPNNGDSLCNAKWEWVSLHSFPIEEKEKALWILKVVKEWLAGKARNHPELKTRTFVGNI